MLNIQEIETLIEQEMAAAKVPGLSIAVVKGGDVLLARGFGVTDAENGGPPVTADTIFRVGSVSKVITGTMIMKLVEQGKIDLDRPIQEYVPEFALSDADAAGSVTMRMLLTHRAGFVNAGTYLGSRDPQGLRNFVREELPHVKLYSRPGELFNYNCYSLDIAGWVAEAVTGRYFDDLVQELVFAPLGMKRSTYDPAVAMTYPLALPHNLTPDGYEVVHKMPENVAHHPSFYLMTTANDLLNFMRMHLQNGTFDGRQVLRPETVQEMQAQQVELQSSIGYEMGLTFFKVQRKGVWLATHFGDISTYSANFYLAPEDEVAVVIMNNRPFPHDKVIAPILDSLLPDRAAEMADKPTLEADPTLWPSYAGAYLGSTAGLIVVEQDGEELRAVVNGNTLQLRPFQDQYAGYNQQGVRELLLRFVPNGEHPCEHVMANNTRCCRIEYDPKFRPEPHWLAAYEGLYSHDRYIGPYRIAIEDGALTVEELEHGSDFKETLLPVAPHLFVGPYAKTIEFRIGADGRVTSYLAMMGWEMTRL
ncbi:CubicO group peptidase (beta-lactamase class C family) [Tumebacillus sp. BK434]|uniref:serine hydrolase n=1 Tax=Tumebacillus sp. BK434 TaxID=2512169 RepID=UPI00104A0903|nr:serine hydrolase [Tumebacillus sp. BK434]TCP59195.1 CubicO group peptidase (beta-lactamase class C family) [Tumebacillus sp. BK434]